MAWDPTTIGLRLDYTGREEAATHRARESKNCDGARTGGGLRLGSPNPNSQK